MRKIVVGTRQSALALTQTGQVVDQLKALCEERGLEVEFELKKIVTKGDRILDVTLSKVGGKGLFVKEIEQALMDGEIDMAVHSMKDMPFESLEGLTIGAVPKREDPRDVLITRDGGGWDKSPQGAKVGTSSLRRSSHRSTPDRICRLKRYEAISIHACASWKPKALTLYFWRQRRTGSAGRRESASICRLTYACLL